MATLTSFFGGGGGCCVDLTTNEWGTLLPLPHTTYTVCGSYTDCLCTGCFSNNTGCCAKSYTVLPLKDNYFLAIGATGFEDRQRGMAVRHMCISDSGNICPQSAWCVLHNNSSTPCISAAHNAISDGCNFVYINWRQASSGYWEMACLCIDYSACTICCKTICMSQYHMNASCGSGYGNEMHFSGKPGKIYVYETANNCHGRLSMLTDGTFACTCHCNQNSSNASGRRIFVPTKETIFWGGLGSSQCYNTALFCTTNNCFCEQFCCQGLYINCGSFFNDDKKRYFVELDYCGSDAPIKQCFAWTNYDRAESGYSATGAFFTRSGHITAQGRMSQVKFSNNTDQKQCTESIFSCGSDCVSWCGRMSTQVNGTLTFGGVLNDSEFNAICYIKCGSRGYGPNDENIKHTYSLGPRQYAVEERNFMGIADEQDAKVYPLKYEIPFVGANQHYRCYNGLGVIGKCWLVTYDIDVSSSGATGCTVYKLQVHKMSNYFA